jgi:REP element-mobilizing transposase RayT
MTAPRQVLPGTTYLVTRRCSERRFFLRPSREANEIFLYVLAVAAQRFGVLVHAFCVLSNHAHLVVTDPRARLPAFMQYLDSLVARAVNESLGRYESFWARDKTFSAVTPIDPGDMLAKCAYVLANPVAAGLVRKGREWPGLWTAPEQIGASTLDARRPDEFFRASGPMPAALSLPLSTPPGFASPEDFRDRLRDALATEEERHRRDLDAQGRTFLGVARVLAQSPFARPSTPARRFRLNPRIAGRDKWKRIEAIARLKAFAAEYRRAWRAWVLGLEGVPFPAGTYLMRVVHGAACVGAT